MLQGNSTELLWPLVAELEAAHMLNRGAGWQDFETHALYLGLRECGKMDRARQILSEYARVYRREKWPLPQNLNELLDSEIDHVDRTRSTARASVTLAQSS